MSPTEDARAHIHDHKRRMILDTAMAVFAERGIEGITLEGIAHSLGYTKPALYYYFRSKEDLLSTLVLEYLREARGMIGTIVGQNAPPGDRLRTLISYYIDRNIARHGYFSVHHHLKGFLEHIHDPSAATELRDLSEEIPRLIFSLISEGIDRGEFRRDDPVRLGSLILGMLSGVIMHLDMPALASMETGRLKDMVCDTILRGIEP